jgi:hypothetical protein
MEAICPSETLVDFQRTTRRYIPEHRTLETKFSQNLSAFFQDSRNFNVKMCYVMYKLLGLFSSYLLDVCTYRVAHGMSYRLIIALKP